MLGKKRLIFVATTIAAELGGIARSVPRLAIAAALLRPRSFAGPAQKTPLDKIRTGNDTEVYLLAPKARKSTLPDTAESEGLEVRLCDGAKGVRRELEELIRDSSQVRFIYHAGVWDPLNHYVARLGRRRGIPVIASVRSMLDPWALNHRKWKKRLAWRAYARRDLLGAAAIHATAELEAGYVKRALGKHGPPVIVVPNGVELPGKEFFSRCYEGRGGNLLNEKKLRDPSGSVRKEPRRLVFLSRIHQKKGVLDLINAFGDMNPEGWELVIAGNDDGGHEADCKRLASRQPNRERIRFWGPVGDADKWDLYRSADLFVLPSYSENFGIVVGEALGMGIPVITTTATPWREYSKESQSSSESPSQSPSASDFHDLANHGLWIVEPGQYPLMRAMKEGMALSDVERAERGRKGAEWIRREFTWKAVAKRFLQAVEQVIRQ